MRFYLATSFTQKTRADRVADALIAGGLTQTFRWTSFREAGDGYAIGPEGKVPLYAVAAAELRAIADADVFIMLAPAGIGTHVELGAALALNKPVIIVGEHWDAFSPFYHHPRAELIEANPDSEKAMGRLWEHLEALKVRRVSA
jgi:nucleoside 2-deoxyribosyltransferase